MGDSFKAQFKPAYLPQFIVTVSIAALQQLTGINAIMFYCGALFHSLGTSRSTALLNTVIVGAVNVIATTVSMYASDRLGRRFLFIEGGTQMAAALTTVGIILGVSFDKYGSTLPSGIAIGTLVVICVFVAAFAWSWGPLGWLVPSEIQTLETRAAGMASAVIMNFAFSFLVGQTFLATLSRSALACSSGLPPGSSFRVFFVYYLVPETRGVPVERVQLLFAKHKVWRRTMGETVADDIISRDANRTASRRALSAVNGSTASFGGASEKASSTASK